MGEAIAVDEDAQASDRPALGLDCLLSALEVARGDEDVIGVDLLAVAGLVVADEES